MEAASLSLDQSHVLTRHDEPIKAIQFGSGPELFATADTMRQLRVWSGSRLVFEKDLRVKHDRFRPLDLIRSIAFSPSGDLLFAGAGETVQAFDSSSGECKWVYHAPPTFGFLLTSTQSLTVSKSGVIAAAFDDGSVCSFDLDGVRRNRWSADDSPRFVSYLHDGERLVGSDGFAVAVWDSHTGARLAKYNPEERIYGLSASPTRDVCAIRTLRSTLTIDLWNGEVLSETATRPGLPNLAFSPDGERLAVAERHSVLLVDTSGATVARFEQPEAAVLSIAFTSDGKGLAAGCSDGTLRLWPIP